jgi:hypothetical protein
MTKSDHRGITAAALLVAIGLAIGGYFISRTLYNARVAINTAEVMGLAERRVQADRAFWTIQYSVSGKEESEVPALYERSEADRDEIVQLLRESGFGEEEISPGVIRYSEREFRDENQRLVEVRYVLDGSIEVETEKVELVASVRSNLNQLIARGLDLRNNAPAYYFTRLNEIKPDMLREATTNARIAANEFADNAGVTVGGIREAKQGRFTVRDAGENFGDTAKIEKDVRVITTVTFYLDD